MSNTESRPERWEPVPGYEGFYEVSDHGSVRSVVRTVRTGYGATRRAASCVLKPGWTREGHLFVVLFRDGQPRNSRVHRLVLEAFCSAAPDGMECCHRDGNPKNNYLGNLYWGTKSQNALDRERHRREMEVVK